MRILRFHYSLIRYIPLGGVKGFPCAGWHRSVRPVIALIVFAFYYPKILILILRSDSIIINGEGTIHHDSQSSLGLLWLLTVGSVLQKRVYLLNATIEAMSNGPLSALSLASCIAVRDPITLQYLRDRSLEAVELPDASLTSYELIKFAFTTYQNNSHRACLAPCTSVISVTFGVLSESPSLLQSCISSARIIKSIFAKRFKINYLVVHDGDRHIAKLLLREGWSVTYTDKIGQVGLLDSLSRSCLVITGRYHIGLFSCLLGKRVHLLRSNTIKMKALHQRIHSLSPKYPIHYSDDLDADYLVNESKLLAMENPSVWLSRQQPILEYALESTRCYLSFVSPSHNSSKSN